MLDGASRIGEVVAAAAADGQPAVGITDHGNMYGALELYRRPRHAGHQARARHGGLLHEHVALRPAEASRARDLPPHDARRDRAGLPQPDQASRASRTSTATTTSPRSDWELLETYHEGITATTGCLGGLVSQLILQGAGAGRARSRRALPGHLRPRALLRRAPGPRHGRRRQGHPPAARHRPQAARAAARDERQPLHDEGARRSARRAAVRADGCAAERPEPPEVRRRRLLHQVRRRDAPPLPRGAGSLRQHVARSPSASTVDLEFGNAILPVVPRARRARRELVPPRAHARRRGGPLRRPSSRCTCASASTSSST